MNSLKMGFVDKSQFKDWPIKCVFVSPHREFITPIFVGTHYEVAGNVEIDLSSQITFGDYLIIQREVIFFTHNHTYTRHKNLMWEDKTILYNNLTLEGNIFIGRKAMILPKVSIIHYGTVIGAGAVLTKSTTGPNEIWAGNPARKIGERG